MRRVLVLAAACGLVVAGSSAGAPSPRRAAYGFRSVLRLPLVVHVAAPASAPRLLYLVQQDGRIRVRVGNKLQKQPFLDLGRLVTVGNEQGLLSMTFHPAYARNRRLYVDYIARNGHTKVVEYRANRAGTATLPKTARLLLDVRQPGTEHKGGQLAFGPDGKLYVSLGDGECCDDPANRAQDMGQLLGKLLRLDVAAAKPAPEIVGLGLRNPWRFSFDRANGDLYIADVGAGLWEEVDYRPRRELDELVNYGWDTWEANAPKDETPLSPSGKLVFPVHAYGHDVGCSITGGFVYRGSAVPAARGRYFYGDYCTGAIWSLRVENGTATDVRREASTIQGLSTFGEDARGELYAASVSTGRVYRLVPDGA